MRILVIEDDREHREDLKRTLGHAKGPCPRSKSPVTFEVETADTVEQARKMLVERGYEFVLLDLNMSGNLEANRIIPLLDEMLIPYAFYSATPEDIESEDAPVWTKDSYVRMDLVTRISDHYHAFVQANRRQLDKAGRFCIGRVD